MEPVEKERDFQNRTMQNPTWIQFNEHNQNKNKINNTINIPPSPAGYTEKSPR
jgi:hypothetical protein